MSQTNNLPHNPSNRISKGQRLDFDAVSQTSNKTAPIQKKIETTSVCNIDLSQQVNNLQSEKQVNDIDAVSQVSKQSKALSQVSRGSQKSNLSLVSLSSISHIDDSQQTKLKEVYERYDKGIMSQHALATYIERDLGLKTNTDFYKGLNQVSMTFGDLIKGIDKPQNQVLQNFQPTNNHVPLNTRSGEWGPEFSLLKMQEIRTKDIRQPQGEKEEACMNLVRQVCEGKITRSELEAGLVKNGAASRTDEIMRNFKEIDAAADTRYCNLGSKVLRAVNDAKQNPVNGLFNTLGDSPTRANTQILKARDLQTNLEKTQVVSVSKNEKQRYATQTELRLIGSNIFYERKGHGAENLESKKYNGDVVTWKNSENVPPEPIQPNGVRKLVIHKNDSNLNIKTENDQNQSVRSYQSPNKYQNSQIQSSYNVTSHEFELQAPRQVKILSHMQGNNGNILTWD